MEPGEIGIDYGSFLRGGASCGLVVTAVFLLMGHFSARLLRRLPDSEQKSKQLWGARWFWLLFLCLSALWLGGAWWGICATSFPFSFGFGALPVLVLVMVGLVWLLRDQVAGVSAWLALPRDRLDDPAFDLAAWPKERRRRWARWDRAARIINPFGVVLVVGMWVFMLFVFGIPLDLATRDHAHAKAVAEVVRTRLFPLGDVPPPGGARRISWWGFKLLHPARERPRSPREQEFWDHWSLFIPLHQGATQAEAEGAARIARETLAQMGEKDQWVIRAYRGEARAKVRYP